MHQSITIYTTRYCGYCFRAKKLLQSKKAAYTEIAVDGDPDARRSLEKKSGSHTVPQIWIGDQHIGGCDDLFRLERSGKLDDILQA